MVILLLVTLILVLLFSLLWQCRNQRNLNRELSGLKQALSAASTRAEAPPAKNVHKVESLGAFTNHKDLDIVEYLRSKSETCLTATRPANHVKSVLHIRSSSTSKLSDFSKAKNCDECSGGGVTFTTNGSGAFGGGGFEKLPSTQSSFSHLPGHQVGIIKSLKSIV